MPGLDEYAALTFTPNGQQALGLGQAVLSYDHDHGERLAQFDYLKRDGAEQEPMGANASVLTYRLVLMGEAPLTAGGPPISAGARYQALFNAQRSQPRGLLVDPRLGRWQVAWSSIRASEEPQRAVDSIEITLVFREDQIDQALAIENQPTPQARANEAVSAYSIVVAASVAGFTIFPVPLFKKMADTAQGLGDAAAALVNAALTLVQNKGVDPSLRSMLENVQRARLDYFAAVDAALTYSQTDPVSAVEYKHAAYMTEAACVELLISIEQLKPQLFDYVTPSAMSLIALLQLVYGQDAQSHREEALRLNPFLPTVTIPAGTTVRLVAPTPRQ